jgi:hypothetical protein
MGTGTTFVFDVKHFGTYRSALESHLDHIRFLGVKDIGGFTKYINLRYAREIVINPNEITIYYDDYYYIIDEKGIQKRHYVKF